jgi:helicase
VSNLAQLHNSAEVKDALKRTENARLAYELSNGTTAEETNGFIARLRVAAHLSLVDVIGKVDADDLLRQMAAGTYSPENSQEVQSAFRNWTGYINLLLDYKSDIIVDDLLSFATAGFLARRPTEVRALLQSPLLRSKLTATLEHKEPEWVKRIKSDISTALLYLIRQENHQDIEQASRLIMQLSMDQASLEPQWLSMSTSSQRNALEILGLYHIAQAVIRISEFLLVGSIQDGQFLVTDIASEIRRLIVRAEEYLALSNELETLSWLNNVAIVLWRLRTDSIWVSGRGISELLDLLLSSLVEQGREQPIFSLLPSQQDALRSSLHAGTC